MKAKYKHYGNDCVIYVQVICVDNIFVKAKTYSGWCEIEPKITTGLYLTNGEARRMFFQTCVQLEKDDYYCEYKEV